VKAPAQLFQVAGFEHRLDPEKQVFCEARKLTAGCFIAIDLRS
jgi:hypothetical protein